MRVLFAAAFVLGAGGVLFALDAPLVSHLVVLPVAFAAGVSLTRTGGSR
jgi:hypothetical protein